MSSWEACYEHANDEHVCKGGTIHFAADTKEEAVTSFKRWWDGREKALPEWFTRLYAVKIFTFETRPIGEDGQLESTRFFPVYEWKCDWGKPLGK